MPLPDGFHVIDIVSVFLFQRMQPHSPPQLRCVCPHSVAPIPSVVCLCRCPRPTLTSVPPAQSRSAACWAQSGQVPAVPKLDASASQMDLRVSVKPCRSMCSSIAFCVISHCTAHTRAHPPTTISSILPCTQIKNPVENLRTSPATILACPCTSHT